MGSLKNPILQRARKTYCSAILTMKAIIFRFSYVFLCLCAVLFLAVNLNPKRTEQEIARERMLDYWNRYFIECDTIFYTFSTRQNNYIALNTDPDLWICKPAKEKSGTSNEVWDVTISTQSSAYYEIDHLTWSPVYDGVTGYWKGHFSPRFINQISTNENVPIKVRFRWVNQRTFDLLASPNQPVKIFDELLRPTSCGIIPILNRKNSELQRSS